MIPKKDFELNIHKGKYSKTILEDKIQTVDTSKKYTYYDVSLTKIYFDVNSKEELIKNIKTDLENLTRNLEKLIDERINDDR